MLQKWGVKIENPEVEFKIIDENHGGCILFEEFCHWAIIKSLELHDDDD